MVKYLIIWTVCSCALDMFPCIENDCHDECIVIENFDRVKELYLHNLESKPRIYRLTDVKEVIFEIDIKEQPDAN